MATTRPQAAASSGVIQAAPPTGPACAPAAAGVEDKALWQVWLAWLAWLVWQEEGLGEVMAVRHGRASQTAGACPGGILVAMQQSTA
ncbi:hypothetical protein BKK81_19000 [Cupriavidus sp. USMAHM13]|nr:hypothetical protein BKK81_19000 [Cupriavidus sp. USMAHM13]